jgi:hypothetical protein
LFRASSKLEIAIQADVAVLRAGFPDVHLEWELDAHDRFVIVDVSFRFEETMGAWLEALNEVLDDHLIKAIAALEGVTPYVVDAFVAAGYEFDVDGNAIRQGLSVRDEVAEKALIGRIRATDRLFRDVYFEWSFSADGALVLEHIESGRTNSGERVTGYLKELAEHLKTTGLCFRISEEAMAGWREHQMVYLLIEAGFEGAGKIGEYRPVTQAPAYGR